MARVKRKVRTKSECETPSCTDEVYAAGKCANCYSAEVRWAKRTVADRRKRRNKLRIWTERMEALIPDKPDLRRVK